MANKNVVIKKRNSSNNDWDTMYPVTTAENVKCGDGKSVDTHLAESAKKTTQNISYYIDAANGNNSNDGLSNGTAFKTIQNAINKIPQIVNHNINIYLAPGTYNEDCSLSGFIGNGAIFIYGDSSVISDNYMVQSIAVKYCQTSIYIYGIKLLTTTTQSLSVVVCNFVRIRHCKMVEVSSFSGITSFASKLDLYNNEISNKQNAIYAFNTSEVFSNSCMGNGNNIALYARSGSKIGKSGTQPIGNTNELAVEGGQVL